MSQISYSQIISGRQAMPDYSFMINTLNQLKEDIGASPLTDLRKEYMIGLIKCLEQDLQHLYVMLPRVVDEIQIDN